MMDDKSKILELIQQRQRLIEQNSLALGPFIAWPATLQQEIAAALAVGRPLVRVHFVKSNGDGRPRDT